MPRQIKTWKEPFFNGPEPEWYAQERDPLHSVHIDVGCEDFNTLTQTLTVRIEDWMKNKKSGDFGSLCDRLNSQWRAKGGDQDTFDRALQMALQKSGYYKKMLKG